MAHRTVVFVLVAATALVGVAPEAPACTNILVTKGATVDGSTFISYAADSHELYGALITTPAGVHGPGEMRDVIDWDSGKFLGRIPQAPVTYAVVGNMNEHQVSIGETTWGGREELEGPAGIIDYGSLMFITLERARTAREAVEIMGRLVEEFGYASTGESFSVADPNEVWFVDMIGKGKGAKGAVWVARRIPDGYVSAHANQARIRQFPLNDPANCLYAKDVISFAREKGWFNGEDEEFSFADTYAPMGFGAARFCEARVWSVFRRVAPSLGLGVEYVDGKHLDLRLPLWVKPDRKLSVHDVMQLMRDHFEGTELDMTKDVGAGPFACPYRWRPMEWKLGDEEYVHERAISTQQTGFSFVAQARSFLPDPIGGIFWLGFDDTYTTVYTPMYCGIRDIPKSYGPQAGNFAAFSWDSAFWVFNFVANWAYTRYSDMIHDIQAVQWELEAKYLADQPEIEKAARKLYETSPMLCRDYLTAYSVKVGDEATARWRKLGEFLIWKYLDGNVRDSQGHVTHPRYPDAWYERIVKERGDSIRVPKPANP
ncbi:MAG: C69 family dipeptidase [Thermoanaerobaculaceae bacterium]|nr:C69 family dipeptidase [Thermoanaerobaculaceae bacterium]